MFHILESSCHPFSDQQEADASFFLKKLIMLSSSLSWKKMSTSQIPPQYPAQNYGLFILFPHIVFFPNKQTKK